MEKKLPKARFRVLLPNFDLGMLLLHKAPAKKELPKQLHNLN
ncbi:hypothetical protein VYF65_001761 [Lysinibacillus irui]